MYTALGLTSLDQVISNWKLRWARHVRHMAGLVEAPSQVPHAVGRRTSLQRTASTLLQARPHARAPADRLQPPQGGRAAWRLAELGSAAKDREKWRKQPSSQLGYRWRQWKRNPSPNKRRRNGLSLSNGLCQTIWQYPEPSRRPVQMPPPGRTDCGPAEIFGKSVTNPVVEWRWSGSCAQSESAYAERCG
jgi:hypothetical protein